MKAVHADDTQSYALRPDNRDLGHIPGDYGLPYVGVMLPLLKDPFAVMARQYARFGAVSRVRLTGQHLVWALGPDFNRELVMDPQQLYSARMGYEGPLGDFFAGGLLMRDFAEHRFHRRIMQSAFKTSSMQHYIHSVVELAARGVARWPAVPGFRYYPHIKELLLEIGARVFVGLDLESDIERLNQAFLDMMAGTLSIVRKDWPGLRYRRGMDGRRYLEHFFEGLVPAKRAAGGGMDMMSHFSHERDENGGLYSDKIVADHMIFLLLAAHDTTTSALTMGSYYLARHPEWQERLRAEVDALDRSLLWEDIGANVPLLEQTFHEILRLHPPVPQMMRRTIRPTELGGYAIPADTLVAISPVFCHRMPEFWKDPHGFDPDRFGAARQEHKQHPYLWVPFGGGAHKCIGLHFADLLFKCVMAEMLRHFTFRLPPGYADPPSIMHFPFAKLMDDLPLLLEPRKHA
jgi:cytochrome P450